MRTLTRTILPLSAAFALVACGDDEHLDNADAAPQVDAAPDVDAPPTDAGIDAVPYVAPTPVAVALSAAGPDQLQSAAAGPGGTFYAAGFVAATTAGPQLVTVVKLTAAGALDTSFGGGDGIAPTTLVYRGGAGEIDVVVQPSGKIVVSSTVANGANANDRDIALTRLDTDGTVDLTFGVAGVRVLDLSTAHDNNGTLVGFDTARDLAVGPAGVLYVYGHSRADGNQSGGGPRTDVDLTVVKLDVDGTQDMTWGGGDGKFTLDIQNVSETARGINVLPDGSIVASGYANSPGLGSVQPVLVKITDAGVLDTAFGTGGLYHEVVLAAITEVYNVAIHGSYIVTGGYGRASGTTNDWVSLRFNATTGARDTTWGGAANGAVLIDPSGSMLADNCRTVVGLPGERTLLVGSAGMGGMPVQDAAFVVLSATGTLDPAFGGRAHTYPLGTNGNDQFWGAAVSGSNAIMVGYKGASTQTDTVNDDSWVAVLPLP